LCFAIKYPEMVRGMVLRGIYLGSKEENDYFLNGGCKTHFPDIWEGFLKLVPEKHRKSPAKYYAKMMNSKDPKIVRKFCKAWSHYELSMVKLDQQEVKLEGQRYIALAKLEAYYLMRDCFLPRGYIMKNVHKIKHIPLVLVQGRYDFVTTPHVAFKLHKALPKSTLHLPTAGHSGSDPGVLDLMMRAIHRMAK